MDDIFDNMLEALDKSTTMLKMFVDTGDNNYMEFSKNYLSVVDACIKELESQ